jgi:DNA gyrase/topoisomerase IV subunit B
LINFFKLWPELFERGIVHILYTPIMEIRKSGKIVKSFYTLSDYKKYKVKSGETIKYLKGLGSLGVNQYKKYLIEQPLIEAVQDDENCDDILEVVFGDDAKLRKEWLE